jgi:hypothetical protein
MAIGLGLILSILLIVLLIYLGGQIDLSFMEDENDRQNRSKYKKGSDKGGGRSNDTTGPKPGAVAPSSS